jgi:hypothetical protein
VYKVFTFPKCHKQIRTFLIIEEIGLNNLCNIVPGGLGWSVSEEIKEKLRIAMTGRKHSEESKRKMSESHLGEKNWVYGKHVSDDVKQKITKTFERKREIKLSFPIVDF